MNIVIADDHPLYRMALSGLLSQLDTNASVVDCCDFDELLDHVENATSDPDLIVMDIRMPGMEFKQALEQLRATYADVPVVVVSASEELEDMTLALNLGADGYIPKSSSRDVLLSAVRLILSGGKYFPFEIFAAEKKSFAPSPSTSRAGVPASGNNTQSLTRRQKNVLDLMAQGQSNKEIAEALQLAESTVKVHITAIFRTLGVSNRTQAVLQAKELA
ncbi:response regulator [Sneathiella sp. P13V-1]|uniref:response regulator transcription factor n=1 Tax=Sneathiella sp. P13V-1 TaxID=2697366 RepID=UPI00187B8606|nr:response regulator transcription factor [Sneathiella sp. P13V-1]MBE7636271.1 response regulator [Sneathiella sp. P13V-1]